MREDDRECAYCYKQIPDNEPGAKSVDGFFICSVCQQKEQSEILSERKDCDCESCHRLKTAEMLSPATTDGSVTPLRGGGEGSTPYGGYGFCVSREFLDMYVNSVWHAAIEDIEIELTAMLSTLGIGVEKNKD